MHVNGPKSVGKRGACWSLAAAAGTAARLAAFSCRRRGRRRLQGGKGRRGGGGGAAASAVPRTSTPYCSVPEYPRLDTWHCMSGVHPNCCWASPSCGSPLGPGAAHAPPNALCCRASPRTLVIDAGGPAAADGAAGAGEFAAAWQGRVGVGVGGGREERFVGVFIRRTRERPGHEDSRRARQAAQRR